LTDADSRESIQAYFERNPGMSFLTKSDDTVIGAVLAGHDGRRGYIHHLAVHPNHRRQGLARQLVDHCLAALANAGIQKCHLFIFNNNTNGMEFWKSIGWVYRSDIGVFSKVIEPKLVPDC
jgi:ribosomal protein S18 acetylase RimI-like enzyme